MRAADDALAAVEIEDADDDNSPIRAIAPVSRLVRRFIDACERAARPSPGFAEGYRVQRLIDAARRAHATGRWIDIAPPRGAA